MIGRTHRLRKSADIQSVVKKGRRIHSKHITVCVLSADRDQPTRIAVVVGKRVSSSAVRRHRMQRWIREIAKGTLSDVPAGYDIVFLGKPSLQAVRSLQELRESVKIDHGAITTPYI